MEVRRRETRDAAKPAGQAATRRTAFSGIIGYDETVIPQVVNAVLSGHDLLFLGLRGQGKTRMLRMLVNLLDDAVPIVAGSEINDDPLAPLSKYARDLVDGRATPARSNGSAGTAATTKNLPRPTSRLPT